MKILQVCSKIPFPPKDGGSLAMNMLTEGLLNAGTSLTVLAMQTQKHFIKDEEIDLVYRRKTNYRSVFIDTSVTISGALKNIFSGKSYNISRFWSEEFEKVLIGILSEQEFDIVQLESLWVTPYLRTIRAHSKAKIVLRSHNVEYRIWERLSASTAHPLKKRYMKLLAARLKKYELSMLNSYDAIATITEHDLESFRKAGCRLPMIFIPFGIEPAKYMADDKLTEFPSVFHIGAMDWRPNVEGIEWVLEKVWPLVQEKMPGLKLYLAGRNMPQWMLDLKSDTIIIEGEVADSQAFINSKSIMIVPLFSGGGMRIKIIEGMALAKTIISTHIGAEGIDFNNGRDLLIADNAADFATAILNCAGDRSYAVSLGSHARNLVENKYDNRAICAQLADFYKTLLVA